MIKQILKFYWDFSKITNEGHLSIEPKEKNVEHPYNFYPSPPRGDSKVNCYILKNIVLREGEIIGLYKRYEHPKYCIECQS